MAKCTLYLTLPFRISKRGCIYASTDAIVDNYDGITSPILNPFAL